MASFGYKLVRADDGSENITAFFEGQSPKAMHSSQPQFAQVKEACLNGDESDIESIMDLFDLAEAAATRFERLTDRISHQAGRLYVDGDEVNNVLSEQIIKFIATGEDFSPLVKFLDNVSQNPSENSRRELYDWLDANGGFSITPQGKIVGYKGVEDDGNGGYQSVHSGKAVVNGEVKEGKIPNFIGAYVTMPRSEVVDDPSQDCSVGLHVGTYNYAKGYAHGAMLEVHVNPRDVVSVPKYSGSQKMRTCAYLVVDIIEQEYEAPLVPDYKGKTHEGWGEAEYDDDDIESDESCWDCGEHEDDCRCDDEEQFDPEPETEAESLDRAEAVRDLGKVGVGIGDVFEDTDTRVGRKGRKVTVLSLEGDSATVESKGMLGTRKRSVKIDRLLSRKYKRVSA